MSAVSVSSSSRGMRTRFSSPENHPQQCARRARERRHPPRRVARVVDGRVCAPFPGQPRCLHAGPQVAPPAAVLEPHRTEVYPPPQVLWLLDVAPPARARAAGVASLGMGGACSAARPPGQGTAPHGLPPPLAGHVAPSTPAHAHPSTLRRPSRHLACKRSGPPSPLTTAAAATTRQECK